MEPLKWARVSYERQAWETREQMSPEERQLLRAAIAAIKNAPDDGQFIDKDEDGTVIRQMTAEHVHVQYAVKFWPIGRVLLVTFIEIRHWEPRDDRPPYGTRQ